jgi:hypothetical protein
MAHPRDSPGSPTDRYFAHGSLPHARNGAAFLVVLGTTGAIIAAVAITSDAAQKSRQAFVESSTEIASTLKLDIQHEQDLIVSAAGFVVGNPNATEKQFIRWADSVNALQRYPELFGLGESVIVPASQLKAFAAQAVANPSAPLGPGGTFQVTPPGKRAFYCFSDLGQNRQSGGPPVGHDFCSGAQGAAALADRDSGQGDYVPIVFGKTTLLAVETPVYRAGNVPSTVASRRAAFIGWIGMSVLPDVLLDLALEGHPRTAASLRFGGGSSNVVFTAGEAPTGSHDLTISLHNGWSVQTYASATGEGLFSDAGALGLLVRNCAQPAARTTPGHSRDESVPSPDPCESKD